MEIIYKYFSILDKQNKHLFWVLVTLISLSLFLEIISLGSLIPFFQIILKDSGDNFFNSIFEKFNFHKDQYIFFSIFFLGLIFLIKTIFITYLIFFKHNFIYQLSCSLSKIILENYENTPMHKNIFSKNAETQRLVLIDVSMTSGGILQMCNAFSEIIIILASLIVLIYLEPTIIFLFLCLSTLLFFLYKIFYKSKIVSWGEMRKTHDTFRRSYLVDLINTLVFSKLAGIKNHILKRYDTANRKTNYYYQLRERWNEIPRTLLEFIAILFILVLFSYFYINNFAVETIIPILSIFTLASLKIIISLNRLIIAMNQIFFSLPALERVKSDANLKFNRYLFKNKKRKIGFKSIKFNKVDFSYNKKEIFNNLSFSFKKKDFIGIFGPSGAGKSTLLSLIMGVVSPTNGNVLINNRDIKKFRLRVGYVSQTHNLSENSIAENIAFGVDKKNINYEKINSLIAALGLDDFIDNLPQKFETIISEKSSNLSVGQAQRIAIARALYIEPDILVFDEPTSSLDIKNELEVIKIIHKFSKNKTVFLVSHKKKNLKFCNKIISISKNNITIKKKI